MTDIIGTDHPLTLVQRDALVALLDVLIPPSEDGRLPGAGGQDLDEFMDNVLVADFDQTVLAMLDALGSNFVAANPAEQAERVTRYQDAEPDAFAQIYLQTLAVYYRRGDVLRALGSGEGPPFPRGNDVLEGDLSLLDPVLTEPKAYRPA